jgi:hypothetical protein
MANQFRRLQKIYGFTIVHGHRSVEEISHELTEKVEAVLVGKNSH